MAYELPNKIPTHDFKKFLNSFVNTNRIMCVELSYVLWETELRGKLH